MKLLQERKIRTEIISVEYPTNLLRGWKTSLITVDDKYNLSIPSFSY
jgi:hypothetical protein